MKKAYVNFRMFDGITDRLQEGKILYIADNRIQRIESLGGGIAKGYETVDLRGRTVIPGLMDLHVHITAPLMTDMRSREALSSLEEQRALNMRSCIRYGITTVRDMGAFPKSIQRWKKRIQAGEAVGPRIFTPNSFITSMDGPPERAPHIPFPISLMLGGQFAERVHTPHEVRRAAYKNIRLGADFLKTQYAETSMFYKGTLVNLSDACFSAIREIADLHGLKVAMHHTESAGFKKGIQFGFDCLEHCALDPLDQRDIEQFVSRNMALVPTLRVNHSCMEAEDMLEYIHGDGRTDYVPECFRQVVKNLEVHLEKPYPPEHKNVYLDVERSIRGYDITVKNLRRLKEAGARIGVGSDGFGCHLNLPGYLWKELKLLTEAGLSNAEALRAATSVNAQILGIEKETGSLEPGKLADFVVIDGNPLEDIACVRNIILVIKDGITYRTGHKETF